MKIDNLKDLHALLELLSKHDVASIELEGLKLQMAPKPVQYRLVDVPAPKAQQTSEVEDEELLYWSSGGRNN